MLGFLLCRYIECRQNCTARIARTQCVLNSIDSGKAGRHLNLILNWTHTYISNERACAKCSPFLWWHFLHAFFVFKIVCLFVIEIFAMSIVFAFVFAFEISICSFSIIVILDGKKTVKISQRKSWQIAVRLAVGLWTVKVEWSTRADAQTHARSAFG